MRKRDEREREWGREECAFKVESDSSSELLRVASVTQLVTQSNSELPQKEGL